MEGETSLWEGQTKTAKKDYFTKKLSPPTFFKMTISNFQEILCSLQYLENSVGTKLKKKIKVF